MSIQSKPQLVEAVMFFNERGDICKEVLFAEFEALLDGVVSLKEYADKQMRLAYVLINPRLHVRSVVLFLLDFNEDGSIDAGWNVPLRQLAERAGRGPDLGAGPIRLACRSQCPVPWHQMHLWDVDQFPCQEPPLQRLRDAVARNNLGLLMAEEPASSVLPERLHVVREEQWYVAPESSFLLAAHESPHSAEDTQRQRLAQRLLKQRRRIRQLKQQQQPLLDQQRQLYEKKLTALQEERQKALQALARQQALNTELQQQLTSRTSQFQQAREEMQAKVRQFEQQARQEAQRVRIQLEAELQAQLNSALGRYKEHVAQRDSHIQQLSEHLELLKSQQAEQVQQAQNQAQLLEQLAEIGIVFVVFHQGAGHLTIPVAEMPRYQQNPIAYAAAKCLVTEEHYRNWLVHYQQPVCSAALPSGGQCSAPVTRVLAPGQFVLGQSNCCAQHSVAADVSVLS